ncbi:REP-associated tyrosine transposase [Celerinatantimonas sp. YJH-8]|uniref:REP-associated tyrosine transposase n=1 Tax=Celerinatantimonas sp. YJH-8 TaxID=3228714 RepID=UPI0038C2ED24
MASYRRTFSSNGSYFYTLKKNPQHIGTLTESVQLLEKALRQALMFYPGIVQAMVVLPDHLHMMLTFPKDVSYQEAFIRSFKKSFTQLLANLGLVRALTPNHPNYVWRADYWQVYLSDEQDWLKHLQYLHFNPVYHGLVKQVKDWPYSTFHQYVEDGLADMDWSLSELITGEFGEP